MSSFREKGARVQYPVTVRPAEDCKYKGQSPFHFISGEMVRCSPRNLLEH